ncbi:cation:proton antiporter [Kutzneria albida]|uniref:Cation/H+ exchanger transmembrane domain-containing protein n=1 Tax=Kutzneria albida DSM 43870 TaxID=1449976 RepID=W5WM66_9PSEU|nr:cation:proton antiporter [Kutzneria albida]AHH99259.1 hypothetical protein KALB_5898 [Kutzneria albida DSM 43870]
MTVTEVLLRTGHALAVLAAVVPIVLIGRFGARRARQPEVIGEILAGLAAGPALLALLGPGAFAQVLPQRVLEDLGLLTQAGLALFLFGLARELRLGSDRPRAGAIGWVTAGAFLPALAAGGLLALLVLGTGDPVLLGTAPTGAFVLMVAVTLAITAVPVLARILTDRGIDGTAVGRLALSSSIAIDAACWLLLALAVALGSGSTAGFLRALAVLGGAALAALLLRRVLRTGAVSALCARRPVAVAVLLGAVALAFAFTTESFGLTAVVGAVLAGLSTPASAEPHWARAVSSVSRIGRVLVPVFFVLTGITVVSKAFTTAPWALVALTVLLGVAAKVAGGHLGARLGGCTHWDGLRVGVLVNTRGLTELIVLQVGLQAHLLTPPLFLALVVMALVSTGMTGPLLTLLDRVQARGRPIAVRQEEGV